MSETRSPGEIAYSGYYVKSGGKSLVSGADLPSWDEQDYPIQEAWEAAAQAVSGPAKITSVAVTLDNGNVIIHTAAAWAVTPDGTLILGSTPLDDRHVIGDVAAYARGRWQSVQPGDSGRQPRVDELQAENEQLRELLNEAGIADTTPAPDLTVPLIRKIGIALAALRELGNDVEGKIDACHAAREALDDIAAVDQ